MSNQPNKDDLIVIGGAGGFIAGALARYFKDRGFTRIRAVDKKPLPSGINEPRRRVALPRPERRRQL
jgi:nucleoside-diphosphate-sugar epimerase